MSVNNWRGDKSAIDPSIQETLASQEETNVSRYGDSEISTALLKAATGTMRGAGGPGNPGPGGPGQRVLKDVVGPSHRTSSRPLAQSKRAEQNRQAQKAFRARKELYIKELEQKSEILKRTEETISRLTKENEELRDYILALQSKLVDVPTPPSVVSPHVSARRNVPSGPPTSAVGMSAAAAAAAVAADEETAAAVSAVTDDKDDSVYDEELKGK